MSAGEPTTEYAIGTTDCSFSEQFRGKCALITGSTQGLGLATAELLLRRGLSGLVISGRNLERGQQVLQSLSKYSAKIIFHPVELANLKENKKFFQCCLKDFPQGFDVLVNAAASTERGGIVDADFSLWENMLTVNAAAPFFLIQQFANDRVLRKLPGTVVNIASIIGYGGVPNLAVYAASKAALMTLSKNAAFSLSRQRVRINTLAIGWTDTPSEDQMQRENFGLPKGWQKQEGAKLPAGRLLHVNEIARWIAHLASSESGSITGSVVDFDHGVLGCYTETPLPN